jgi:membrane protein
MRPGDGARLSRAAWKGVATRSFAAFRAQGMTDWAATLAYYTILSIVPILLVAAAITTLVGASSLPQAVADEFVDLLKDHTSSTTADASADGVRELVANALDQAKGGASVALVLSVLLALNGASGAFAAAGRALNEVHHLDESRGFVRHKLADVATAVLVILVLALAAAIVLAQGGIGDSLFSSLGLGDVSRTVWSIAQWPLAALLLVVALGVIYQLAPDFDRDDGEATGGWLTRFVTPGAVTALVLWLVASIAFAIYVQVAGFGSAYGALGGAVVLLFYLWLSSAAFLFGAEVDAEVARTLLLRTGGPPPASGVSTTLPGARAGTAAASD